MTVKQPDAEPSAKTFPLQARATELGIKIPIERMEDIAKGARQLAVANERIRAFLAGSEAASP